MKVIRISLFLACLVALIGVRAIESWAFYDPFLYYFRQEGIAEIPDFDWGKLILSHLSRYLLNVVFSCGIVYALFMEKKLVKQTAVIMLAIFALVFPLYLWCLGTDLQIGDLITFYLRRFVIQPILLLIIIPIFYFQRKRPIGSN